jgi:ADP-heptose:LPS heptosyltransferase
MTRARSIPASLWQPTPQRIAVFRALQLGDMLCSVPALRALRRAHPSAHITLIGLPSAEPFVQRFRHYIDELMLFPGAAGFPEQAQHSGDAAAFHAAARACAFDVALQLHGDGSRSNAIVAALGVRRVGGFVPQGQPAPAHHVAWPDDLPEPLRYLSLTRFLGLPDDGPALEFPLSAEDRAEAQAVCRAHGLSPGRYVCLHGGARLPSRRWPAMNFAQLGRTLVSRGWTLVLTGAADEAPLVASLARMLAALGCPPNSAVNVAGRTSLGGMAALVDASRLLVSNDTGVSHIAAALRHPSVIVASGSDVARWAPLDRQRHRVLWGDAPCRPCAHAECPYDHSCAWAVHPDQVMAQIDAQLKEPIHAAA